MQNQEIKIGSAIYELSRVYAGKNLIAELIREKLEAYIAAVDKEQYETV